MKNTYPNYLGKMRDIENNISIKDKEVLEEYNKFCLLSSGKEKTEQRKRYALQFLDIAEKPFNEFDRDVIEHIYNLIKNSDRETGGKNEVIKQLKFFVNWKFEDANLLKGIKALTQRKGYNTKKLNSSTLITKEEIEALIKACASNPKKIAMISLQVELGLRPQELLNLKWKDVKIDDEIGEIKVFSNKTKETRVLPFKNSIGPLLKWKKVYHYPNLKQNDYIFPHPYIRDKPLYRTYLSQLYKRLSDIAGIRHLYPYLARHTKMTELNKKLPSKVASAYGGHSEKIAERYTHLNENDIREVVLKEIYNQKEPDIKKRKELEREIDTLKKQTKLNFRLSQELFKLLPDKIKFSKLKDINFPEDLIPQITQKFPDSI